MVGTPPFTFTTRLSVGMRKRQQKVENVLKTQLLDLKNSLAVNLLHTALSNG